MKPRAYKIQWFLLIVVVAGLFIVLFSDISTPITVKGWIGYKKENKIWFSLWMWITFISAYVMIVYAYNEKNKIKVSYLICISAWMFMLLTQYWRVSHHEGLFRGLLLSIGTWTLMLTTCAFLLRFIFLKHEKKKQEIIEQKALDNRVKKIGNNYHVDLGGEIIIVTEKEVYGGDPNKL